MSAQMNFAAAVPHYSELAAQYSEILLFPIIKVEFILRSSNHLSHLYSELRFY